MPEYLAFTVPVFAVGAAAFAWANRRATPAVRRARWIKFATYVVIVHVVLGATVLGRPAVIALVTTIAIGGAMEMLRATGRIANRRSAVGIVIAYIVVCAGALWFSWRQPPRTVGYLYVIVAVFDGFCQAGGQLAGRTKLAPVVSPGKTVEGLLTGLFAAMAAALLMRGGAGVEPRAAIVVAVVGALSGMSGDLAASWVKRRSGIKDYGAILPGHGGLLDRFDSFLAAAAALALWSATG